MPYKTLSKYNLPNNIDDLLKVLESAKEMDAENLVLFESYLEAYKAFRRIGDGIEEKTGWRYTKAGSRKQCTNERWHAILVAEPMKPQSQVIIVQSAIQSIQKQQAAEKAAKAKKDAELQTILSNKEKVMKAVIFLKDNGYTYTGPVITKSGTWRMVLRATDESLAKEDIVVDDDSDILEMANKIALDKAIANMKKYEFIGFGGDGDCSECSGWDMESHRCECGNRRVSWEHYGDFENMTVYGQAN